MFAKISKTVTDTKVNIFQNLAISILAKLLFKVIKCVKSSFKFITFYYLKQKETDIKISKNMLKQK